MITAWGVTALENATALAAMAKLLRVTQAPLLARRLSTMLHADDQTLATLAAALVDNAVNGHDVRVLDITPHGEYAPVLTAMYAVNPRRYHAPLAIQTVDRLLTPAALAQWPAHLRQPRQATLTHLRTRLTTVVGLDILLGS